MKISEYMVEDKELFEFIERVRTIINYGKYQVPVVTSPPSWAGNLGEMVLYRPVSGGTTQYFYAGTAWVSSWSVII